MSKKVVASRDKVYVDDDEDVDDFMNDDYRLKQSDNTPSPDWQQQNR